MTTIQDIENKYENELSDLEDSYIQLVRELEIENGKLKADVDFNRRKAKATAKELDFIIGVRNHWFEQYKRVLINENKDNLTRQDKSLLKAWEEIPHTTEDEKLTTKQRVIEIPEYADIKIKKEYTPIELFILHNEPAGKEDIAWRRELKEAIEYFITAHPAEDEPCPECGGKGTYLLPTGDYYECECQQEDV